MPLSHALIETGSSRFSARLLAVLQPRKLAACSEFLTNLHMKLPSLAVTEDVRRTRQEYVG